MGVVTGSCVVTGGARGIGRGIAAALVERGHQVLIGDVDGDAAAATAAEIGAAAGLAQDVRDPDSHRRMAGLAREHGDLVGWFNNAGVGHDGDLAELSDDQVRRIVEVNLLGVAWGMRAAFAAFGPRGGDVVNVASLSGLGPVPGLSAYAATKAAVVSLTMSTSLETPPGVRVHALCPDGVATGLLDSMRPDGTGKQLVLSGGRVLTVEEVAARAVGMMGRRRVLLTVPVWRAVVMRGAAVLPSQAGLGLRAFAAQGARVARRG